MVVSRRGSNHSLYTQSRKARIKLLDNFPKNSKAVWTHNPGTVLTVSGHDREHGRVKFTNGSSYIPDELEKYPKE